MSNQIIKKDKMSTQIVKKDGKEIYRSKYVDKIIGLMENEEFREFFDENCENWVDIKAAIMFMKTYQTLDETYQKETGGEKLDKENMVFLMNSLVTDAKYRKSIVNEMIEFTENKKLKKIKKCVKIKTIENKKE